MKLEVGMYVRGKYYGYRGKIDKIIKNYNNDLEIAYTNGVLKTTVGSFLDDNTDINGRQYVASFDIIDLIEVGDILEINGEKYEVIYDESYEKLGILIPSRKELSIRHSALEYVFKKYEVAIVTKEQFEQISYKIGDDKE